LGGGHPESLSESVRSLLTTPENTLFFSAANLWEIVIKRSLGREDFKVDPARLNKLLIAHGYIALPITAEHALKVETLPLLHKDPFDRLLIAQARLEGMQLLTIDALILQYKEPTINALDI
jgi:PIN domain nuclease of toxin-antitoxin system